MTANNANQPEKTPEYNEGDVVAYVADDGKDDTARVRRVYQDSLELVNRERGYQLIEFDRVSSIVGEVIPGSYACHLHGDADRG